VTTRRGPLPRAETITGRPRFAPAELQLAKLLPSGRSLVLGFALLLGGMLAYATARQTSLFAIRGIQVEGAPPHLAREIRAKLAPLSGESLLRLDPEAVRKRLVSLPEVRRVTYDRAFPHTLRVFVRRDPPVAVLRSGPDAWLLSARGRLLRSLERPFPRMPRVWVGSEAVPAASRALSEPELVRAIRALGGASRSRLTLLSRVSLIQVRDGQLVFLLRSGTELRLGPPVDVELKLAVAAKLLASLPRRERKGLTYVDLSIPSRPVAGS
jgi:cell division septal protein FtsQ